VMISDLGRRDKDDDSSGFIADSIPQVSQEKKTELIRSGKGFRWRRLSLTENMKCFFQSSSKMQTRELTS
jgi:hypothetical protein